MTTKLTVSGMSCGGCEATVEEALKGVAGVTNATADRETDTATIEGDADVETLVSAVENAGYDASA
ncbi:MULTISPECIES: heavy-metal-associated domain-containing protein [unclassified Haladaptatus]|uniref:heavy-metal-associated domain-containing protein n=1 Tax=unclassified Haladaptatus TaxID=2622732 RepID=UPI0023E8E83F|nr:MULTISPECIES: heavy metal-associated domain-containing protein [unclassified Haladaptatus]